MQAGPQDILRDPVSRARNASTRNYKPLYTDEDQKKKEKKKETEDSEEEEEADKIKSELDQQH